MTAITKEQINKIITSVRPVAESKFEEMYDSGKMPPEDMGLVSTKAQALDHYVGNAMYLLGGALDKCYKDNDFGLLREKIESTNDKLRLHVYTTALSVAERLCKGEDTAPSRSR
jgi:hypothetical protein